MQIELKGLQERILYTEDKEELQVIEMELVTKITQLHKDFKLCTSKMEFVEIKGNLSIANALLGICKERRADVSNQQNRLNYNFRMAAKTMLHASTYQEIMKTAQLPRKEVKAAKDELVKNKLQ